MTSQVCSKPISHSPKAHRRNLLSVLSRLSATYRQRQTLRKLDDTALRDIGLTRKQAAIEAKRPVWDAPSNWRR